MFFTFAQFGFSSRMDFHMFAVLVLLLACVEQSLASCVVDSFTVKEDFDPVRVSRNSTLLGRHIIP